MFTALAEKLKEAAISVLPVAFIIFLATLTPFVELTIAESIIFLLSALLLCLGIALFNFGAEIAMLPMGQQVGSSLTKMKKPHLLLIVAFVLGVLITIAEPDLSVLAEQVKDLIPPLAFTFIVGVGVGIFLLLAILRIIIKENFTAMLLFFYMLLFALSALIAYGSPDFLALAFDSGGVTTGPITVPFIMALGVGVAATIGGRKAGENSFGLIALCSVGPILAVLLLGIFFQGEINYELPDYAQAGYTLHVGAETFLTLLETIGEVVVSLSLLAAFFFVINFLVLHLPKKQILKISLGIGFTFVGLVLFLTAVKIGFMPVGYKVGSSLASSLPTPFLVGFAVVLGMVAVLAEPAVHVLKKQIEEITEGSVGSLSVSVALSVGVGLSIGLSVLRIVFDFNILYYLVPGYLLSFALSFFVPKLYTAMAFDSGGVASGPLMSGFILPFAIGVCVQLQGADKIFADAFGVVAMVAMAPLISIQLLGFKGVVQDHLRRKNMMKRIEEAGDEQIIRFI